jgi:hypothetical protein
VRQFTTQHGLSLLFNLGHWFFSILINVLLLQRLRNPVMASKKHRAGRNRALRRNAAFMRQQARTI